ncbi:molybdate ABC transporter substrate-binding protein [Caminibacter sp.]
MRFVFLLLTFVLLRADVYVASAANLTYAMPSLIHEFHKSHPNVKIKLILSSSGKLTAQVMHGAPYDIFLSANMKYPNFLYEKGFSKTKPVVYAKGAIGLFSVKFKNLSLNNLKNLKCIAIANPKTAPYGRAAIEAFKKAGIYDNIKNKLVYAETVSSVIPYAVNSCDVGVIAKSSIFSKNIKNIGNFYYKDIPSNLYSPIKQGIVLLSDKKAAKEFYDFMLSKKAKEILKKYGYIE